MSSHGDQLTPREHAYIRAVLAYASGSLLKAVEEFSNMLMEYPLGIGIFALKSCGYQVIMTYKLFFSSDAVAVALSVFSCIMMGEFERMRDTLARVLVFWTEDMQLYPFMLAL